MENMIVNIELVTEFEMKSENPVAELQFKGGVSYGTAFTFIKTKKAPKRESTMKRIAKGMDKNLGDLFQVSRTAS